MKKRAKNLFMLPFLLGMPMLSMNAQEKNVAVISPSDSMEEIINKAANVVPTLRQFNWQRQELTAFLHFGMNTFTDKEWGEGKDSPMLFNPTRLNADQWIKTLKDAGFKSAILTCKHHDGFCLWPSAYTDYSVKNSPWKDGQGDVVKEVSEACKRYDMGFGVYLSPWDRNSSLYGEGKAYNDYFTKQLEELLTKYGKVSEVWFDGANGEGPNGKRQEYDFVRWYRIIRQLQPDAVIAVMGPDVRWVGTENGRGRETEWSVVPKENIDPSLIADRSQQEVLTPPVGDMMGDDIGGRQKIAKATALVWYPSETDVSIRPGWFYHENEDNKVKSPEELVDIYFSSVGRNSVLLLNVPPNKEGLLASEDIKALKGFSKRISTIFEKNLLSKNIDKNKTKKYKILKPTIDNNYDTSCKLYRSNINGSYKERNITSFVYELKSPIIFNICALQEEIRRGQKVEKFSIDILTEKGVWRKIIQGTTIGYKRLLRFQKACTKVIRLNIEESRGDVFISEFGLYLDE